MRGFQLLQRFLPHEQWKREAKAHADACGLAHHVPHRDTIPADLRDKEGTWQLTDNGYPVPGRVLPEDNDIGAASPVLPLYIGLYALMFSITNIFASIGLPSVGFAVTVAYFIGFFIYFGWLPTIGMLAVTIGATASVGLALSYFGNVLAVVGLNANIISTCLALLPAFFPLLTLYFSKRKRASQLSWQGHHYGGAAMNAPKAVKNNARHAQAEKAEADKSYFTTYGTATGQFSFQGDEFAPDAGLAIGQTTNDQSTNLVIFGAIGSGKTTNIRQIFKGQIEAEKVDGKKRGCVVLDGKAVLANDCAKYLDVVVSTEMKNFNFIEGIPSAVLARTFEDIFAPKKNQTGNSSYFTAGARSMLFVASVFQTEMVKAGTGKKSFMELYRIGKLLVTAADTEGNHPLVERVKDHPDLHVEGTLLNDAIEELITYQNDTPENKRNIYSTFKSWLVPFIQSEKLRHWADCENSDFKFNDVFYGGKVGFVLPESQLGIAGVAITALMKARLFTGIADRGLKGEKWHEDGQTPVCLFIDEAQKVMNDTDMSILPQSRSLGMVAFYATQNYDNFIQCLGRDGAATVIESFRSIISLKSSFETYKLLAERVGKARIWTEQSTSHSIGYSATSKYRLSKPIFDPQNPERAWMRKFSGGFLNSILARKGISDVQTSSHEILNATASREPSQILQDIHIQSLNEPFTAIAIVQRAGVERRDVIRTIPLDANFNPIKLAGSKAMFKEAA